MKILTIAIFCSGLGAGVMMAWFGGWDAAEPIIGMATLAVSAAAWLSSQLLGRALEASSVMDKKDFSITLGLRRGYDGDGVDHSVTDVEQAVQSWMQNRVQLGLPIVTGMIRPVTLIYPVRNGEDGRRVTTEPSVVYEGVLSPKYDLDRPDAEVVKTISDLARCVGTALGQRRVYASYCGKQWTIDL